MELSWIIGDYISEIRQKLGLTQEDMARVSGVSRQHYINVERGRKRVSIDIVLKIANGLGLSLIGLLEKVELDGVKSFINPHEIDDNKKIMINQEMSLYYQGDGTLLKSPKRVIIIGKKKPTEYGLKVCKLVTKWFVNQGYVIVSGFEEGIDTTIHNTCQEFGGKSIAVLNSGLRNILPKSNKELADRIIQNGGLLLSEYPAITSSKLSHSMDSRKIQMKLGQGVIIIESQLGSNEMNIGLKAIKDKGLIACVRAPKEYLNKTKGNVSLIDNHKVFVLRDNTLPAFEKMLREK